MKTDSNVTWFYVHEYPKVGYNDKPMYVAIIFHGDSKNTYAYSMATPKYSFDFTKSKLTEESMPDGVYEQYKTFYQEQTKDGKNEFIHTIKDKFTAEHKNWQGFVRFSNNIDAMHKLWLKTFTNQEYPDKITSRKNTKSKFSSR